MQHNAEVGFFTKPSSLNMKKNSGITTHNIKWCDLRCEYADFAKVDALDGSCRTFLSLWCNKLKKHVTKNAPCEVLFGKRRPTTGF
jgi:coproporphyrinogen III oxidase-like Fe-S oxidoreductase